METHSDHMGRNQSLNLLTSPTLKDTRILFIINTCVLRLVRGNVTLEDYSNITKEELHDEKRERERGRERD